MSWDVMIFSLKEKVSSVEEIEDDLFIPVHFHAAMEKHFSNISADKDYMEINGSNFSIGYFADENPEGNLLLHLDGENAMYALISISKIQGWQIFDTGNGEMIDLDHPETNGYTKFQEYLKQVSGQ